MAIEFKKIDGELRNTPLTKEELVTIELVEKYIDGEITRDYKGVPVKIKLDIADFNMTISGTESRKLAEPRRMKMFVELKSRYLKAGWKIDVEKADYRDTYAVDYLVLSGGLR